MVNSSVVATVTQQSWHWVTFQSAVEDFLIFFAAQQHLIVKHLDLSSYLHFRVAQHGITDHWTLFTCACPRVCAR